MGIRVDDELEDHLWNDFESCAQSVTLLYRNPTWKTLQKAAASTTQLYKSGLERQKKAFDKGYMAGRQSIAKEMLGLRKYRELPVEEIWKLLSKPLCPIDHSRSSPDPSPEPSDNQAVDVFQQALCVPSNGVVPQQSVNELNSFLCGQLNRHRKRVHSSPSITSRRLATSWFFLLLAKRYNQQLTRNAALFHRHSRRKKNARAGHERSQMAKKLRGHKAKLYHKKRYSEKVEMRKLLRQHEEKQQSTSTERPDEGAVPTYLLDRHQQASGTILSNMIKEKRKQKAGKYQVPLPAVRAVSDAEAFKVVKTGKTRRKGWKRMVTKVTFVGESFTRKPAKFERFIRPMGLRFNKAHVTHPELQTTFQLPIVGVKKNPSSHMYTSLGVITKGTIIEVNTSELGMVTQGGKVVWAKYAQVTNNPENDGCINAVLLL
ncbi:unnamed protein product [Anisakis simplex]|uniref:Ribosome biogenesis protein NSA2 homolog n=1 Tax=Anisakis simplex TaxID=6269 RepID=A0A0M3JVK5_ANISI|nr:unnamed protein product [Anisakis simplex]